ncbi:unnamed protein product, partial [marine sediment metagenome]
PETASTSLVGGAITVDEPGVYQLVATVTLLIGTGNTAVVNLEANGVPVAGITAVNSTGNQNTIVAVTLTGYFPLALSGVVLRLLYTETTGGASADVLGGQFWVKRDYAVS